VRGLTRWPEAVRVDLAPENAMDGVQMRFREHLTRCAPGGCRAPTRHDEAVRQEDVVLRRDTTRHEGDTRRRDTRRKYDTKQRFVLGWSRTW